MQLLYPYQQTPPPAERESIPAPDGVMEPRGREKQGGNPQKMKLVKAAAPGRQTLQLRLKLGSGHAPPAAVSPPAITASRFLAGEAMPFYQGDKNIRADPPFHSMFLIILFIHMLFC